MRCERPGCTGTIEDGYCNVCGLAPVRTIPAPHPVTPASGRSAAGSGPVPSGSSGTRASSSSASQLRSGSSRTRTTGRSHLGAGLVNVPPIPYRDPSTAVMANPEVPQDRRFCAHCGEPVGRDRAGATGKTEGFCRNCGHHYSFSPKLLPGMLVAAQYEVVGCLAHGGLGWIYLARDRNVSDRWVVLKGLLDAGDTDAMAAALTERRFLAEVEHPNIVKIFNFVQHQGSGYIVMEYVGGSSLKDLLKQRRDANSGVPDPIPVDQAIAYILEILPALGYLHTLGLLFCDFKPDNVIQTDEALKLIDLGGVRRMDDDASAVYGTVGYQAPEIADDGPSVPSDLYTVARTLAVLIMDFKGYQGAWKFGLPGPDDVALFARFDSLYRLLLKGTAGDPVARFQSADEMAQQLVGVLREIVAATDGHPHPAPSDLFTSDLRAIPQQPDWRLLPAPRVSSDDPAAGFLATITVTDPGELVDVLRAAPVRSTELDLRLARSLIEAGQEPAAEQILNAIETAYPQDWRVQWYRGLLALNRGDPGRAWSAFEQVYADCPGELAPKLALGVAAETGNDPPRALCPGTTWCPGPTRASPPRHSVWPAAGWRSATASARSRPTTGCPMRRAPISRPSCVPPGRSSRPAAARPRNSAI